MGTLNILWIPNTRQHDLSLPIANTAIHSSRVFFIILTNITPVACVLINRLTYEHWNLIFVFPCRSFVVLSLFFFYCTNCNFSHRMYCLK